MESNELTRRQLLVRSAVTATTLSLSMSMLAAARTAKAEVNPPRDATADNTALNALLKAEYDAIATYTAGAGIIAADTATDAGLRDTVTKVAVHFQDQHKQHAAALKALIEANGGTAATDDGKASIPASFSAAPQTTTSVIQLAADKERGAAFTYASVLQTISTAAAAKLIASIGGVESQHFVVLYLLAEGLIAGNPKTNSMAALVVPAAFILDVGPAGSVNLDNFPALDQLLAYDVKPA
ncbi:MAG TPA: ferritin-like domain-containing protein [Polyangiales bacterium]|nr:ferritin-like domain-containing protein [Polyangiales bacterium]